MRRRRDILVFRRALRCSLVAVAWLATVGTVSAMPPSPVGPEPAGLSHALFKLKPKQLKKANKPDWFPDYVAPGSGPVNILVIPMQFTDRQPDTDDRSGNIDYIEDLMFGDDAEGQGVYPFESFKQYYEEQSFGAVEIQGTVLDWGQANQNQNYYAQKNGNQANRCFGLAMQSTANGFLTCSEGSFQTCLNKGGAQELVEEALNYAVDQGEDLTDYDNDGDGVLDGIIVMHVGPGGELTGNCGDIWSHQFGSESFSVNGTTTHAMYVVVPERFYCPSQLCETGGDATYPIGIGVLVHEYGHIFGLPDLYALDGNGVGEYSWMGWGIYGSGAREDDDWGPDVRPAGVDPWSCVQLGWCQAQSITENQCAMSLRPLTNGTEVLRVNVDTSGDEYYLVSYLPPTDNWHVLGANGISIYHADDQMAFANLQIQRINTNACIQDEESCNGTHYWVAYEQKDGRYDLEKGINRSDLTDVWQLFDSFNPNEPPTSCSYDATQCNTAISVKSLLSDQATVKVVVDPSNLPPEPQLLAVPTGEQLRAQVGRPYAFEPQLLSGQSDDLRWHLINAPQGMTIDELTGQIEWTPTAEQVDAFDVRILIENCAGEFTQSWKMVVRNSGGGGCSTGAMGDVWLLLLLSTLLWSLLRRRRHPNVDRPR